MSDGIYVGRFLTSDGHFEYRVKYCKNVTNCDDDGSASRDVVEAYRTMYWSGAPSFMDEKAAWEEANRIRNSLPGSKIKTIPYDSPLTMDPSKASDIIRDFFGEAWPDVLVMNGY